MKSLLFLGYYIICFLLVFYFYGIRAGEVSDCVVDESKKLPEARLHKDLFKCGYNINNVPKKNPRSKLTVSLTAYLKAFFFSEEENHMVFATILIWKWKDEYIVWDPKKYQNLNYTTLDSNEIWTPEIASDLEYDYRDYTYCSVTFEGDVSCVVPSKYKLRCAANLYHWPFDTQQCSFEFAFNSVLDDVQLSLQPEKLLLDELVEAPDWQVFSSKLQRTNGAISVVLDIKRHPSVQINTIIIPILVLASLTISSFLLNGLDIGRLLICCCSICGHLVYAIYLGKILPRDGDQCPLIMAFLKNSLFLSLLALLFSIIANNMEIIWNRQLTFLKKIYDNIENLTLIKYLIPSVDAFEQKKDSEWKHFSTLIDRLIFIIFIFLYILACY